VKIKTLIDFSVAFAKFTHHNIPNQNSRKLAILFCLWSTVHLKDIYKWFFQVGEQPEVYNEREKKAEFSLPSWMVIAVSLVYHIGCYCNYSQSSLPLYGRYCMKLCQPSSLDGNYSPFSLPYTLDRLLF
jgi:hypothetical protein